MFTLHLDPDLHQNEPNEYLFFRLIQICYEMCRRSGEIRVSTKFNLNLFKLVFEISICKTNKLYQNQSGRWYSN